MTRIVARPFRRLVPLGIAVLAIALVAFTPRGRQAAGDFLAALRIARPQTVTVNLPSGTGVGYRLQEMLTGMLADSAASMRDEPSGHVSRATEAAADAGFTLQLPSVRSDTPSVTSVGAHDLTVVVDRSRLQTILAEAGKGRASLPEALQGTTLMLHTPRAVRLEYGHCPAPAPATLITQVQGPPPPPSNIEDCLVLTETPSVQASVPTGLSLDELTEIALEISGLSPERAAAVQRRFQWASTLTLSMPRFIRSFDSVTVNARPAVLFGTGGRRGPLWMLIWSAADMTYTLTGYGNPADAVSLAESVR